MRPNFRSHIGSIDFLNQFDRNNHVGDHAVDHLLACELAEIPHGRTAIVVDQDVRLRTVPARSAFWPSGVATSATTGITLTPGNARQFRRSGLPAFWRRAR